MSALDFSSEVVLKFAGPLDKWRVSELIFKQEIML